MSVRLGQHEFHAVLMDLDGTLYRQAPLRKRMIRQLLMLPFRTLSLGRTRRVFAGIRVFRRVREELRAVGRPEQPLERLQYDAPAQRLGCDPGELEEIIREWMYERPLPYLADCLYPGLTEFLDGLAGRGVRVGVFSDYPARAKLAALGLADRVSLQLCATDAEVNAFKPHPRGFQRACEIWGLEPAEVLYVGDRPEVDAAGASAAGMPCVILGDGDASEEYYCASDYASLWHTLGGA